MAAKKREEMFDLIPAYALGALDEDERTEFEIWLRQVPEAQTLVADYQAVTDHLVALTPLHPAPDHLHDDLRQRLAARQRHDDPGKPVKAAPRTIRRRTRWMLAAAALLVVIVGALLTQVDFSDEPDSTPDAAQLYTQLSTQSDANQYQVVAGEVDDAVSGRLIVSSDGKRAVLRLSDLPPITDEQTFQMWLVDESGTRTSGGLFRADEAQDAFYIHVPFEGPVSAYRGVGVSLEPAGGSPYEDQPTGPRVLSVPLS